MRNILFCLCFLTTGTLEAQTTADFVAEINQHRVHYKQEFIDNTRSPLTAQDTALLDFYPPNPTWRITARFERTPDAQPFDMATYSGKTKPFVCYGYATFDIDGEPCKLALYQNLRVIQKKGYEDSLFLPFKDHSNGDVTYGGGRYLDFRTSDITNDDIITLDFNKAHNPWCAYSDGYNCPVPPAENHLDLPVSAGERNYKGEKKH
ncbi:MAG: DUF1684 domain-containing protein [Bacteroidetes bacterium]|nr:MAG: DUF1684 domain-containing protein [Bacteroidota bacterium]